MIFRVFLCNIALVMLQSSELLVEKLVVYFILLSEKHIIYDVIYITNFSDESFCKTCVVWFS